MSELSPGIAILKRDAIEDGLASQIINSFAMSDLFEISDLLPVDLRKEDAYAIYAPEFRDTDSCERRILMEMGIRAMVGINLYIQFSIFTEHPNDITEGMMILNKLKGKVTDDPSRETVRGIYKAQLPTGLGNDIFKYGPYMVRNRIHIPDTVESYYACKGVLDRRII